MSTTDSGNPNEAFYGHEPVAESTNPDGTSAKAFDFDGDGSVDNVYADTTGDGNIDTRFIDTDGDGTFDYADIDSDGDGIIDTTAYDTDGDSKLDLARVDVDGDGYADEEHAIDPYGPDSVTDANDINNLPAPPNEQPLPADPTGTGEPTGDSTDGGNSGEPINDTGETEYLEGQVEFDTDGDGQLDGALVDGDSDGNLDTMLIDHDGDGLADEVWMDTTGDGTFDSVGHADGNGEINELEDFDGPEVSDFA